MAAYRRVYDSRHLQTDCQEPGSAPESYYRQSSMGYIYLLHSAISFNCESGGNQVLLAYCVHVWQQSLKSLKYWQQKAAALPLTRSEYRSFTTDIPCVYNELIDKCSLHGNNWRLGATREDPGPRASVPCVGSPDSDSVHIPHRGAPREMTPFRQKLSFLLWIRDRTYHLVHWGHPSPRATPTRDLDQFSRVCTAQDCDQQKHL